jgi:curli biogenesis system outer membrane secretion channel CsgG
MKFQSLTNIARISCSAMLLTGLFSTLPVLSIAQAGKVQIAQSQLQGRLRVAVLDFDYASTGADNWWYSNPNAAQGISDLLTNRLVQSGKYTVIERSRIAEILQEQNLGTAGRIDSSTAAQVGHLLGADAVIIGSVTRFNLNEEGGSVSILGFGGNNRTRKAQVALTARIVNTTTGEIMNVAESSAETEKGSRGVSVSILGSGSSTSDNDNELLSTAAEQAVTDLASKLANAAS